MKKKVKKSNHELKKKDDTKSHFLNLSLFSKERTQLLNHLQKTLRGKGQLLKIFTPNPEQLVLAQNDAKFAETLGNADILLPDGVGLVVGSKIFGFLTGSNSVTERITGIDMASGLLDVLHNENHQVLILGGRDYHGRFWNGWYVRKFSKQAQNTYDQQRVLWWISGFQDAYDQTAAEQKQVLKAISQLKPSVIFVALGAPNQEFWVDTHKDELQQAGVKIALVVGGAFDMLLGKLPRAPRWFQALGLEWLYRLYQEPSRWRRQVNLIKFMKLVVQEILDGRF